MTTAASYSSAMLGSSSSVSNTSIDVHHPYYLHPSDNPGMQITNVVLGELNYNQWSRSMEIALSSKLKLGFVDGSYLQPSATSPLLVHWCRCNNMVTSWILNSVFVDIRNSVVYMKSARDIWTDLSVRYAQSNVPKLFHLRSEISHLTQGTLSIASYFSKFRAVHDELDCITSKPRCTCATCTCSVNIKLAAVDHDIQLSQFLMGLNDQFTGIRGQILMMTPLPSLSQCYALLLQEETQRSISHSPSFNSESMAMAVKNNNFKPAGFKGVKKLNQDSKDNLHCDFCHLTGHTRHKCFCVHGYPAWHKLFGKPKPKPRFPTFAKPRFAAQISSVDSQVEHSAPSNVPGLHISDNMSLSTGQCQQLIQLLQKTMSSTAASSSSSQESPSTNSWYSSINSTQFAGTITHFAINVYPHVNYAQDQWIVDTGATDHITPFPHLLTDLRPFQSLLHLPNGATAHITQVGNVILNSVITLTNVLCVPSFTYNLLSISKLVSDTSSTAASLLHIVIFRPLHGRGT